MQWDSSQKDWVTRMKPNFFLFFNYKTRGILLQFYIPLTWIHLKFCCLSTTETDSRENTTKSKYKLESSSKRIKFHIRVQCNNRRQAHCILSQIHPDVINMIVLFHAYLYLPNQLVKQVLSFSTTSAWFRKLALSVLYRFKHQSYPWHVLHGQSGSWQRA